jgi:hypothetical protein
MLSRRLFLVLTNFVPRLRLAVFHFHETDLIANHRILDSILPDLLDSPDSPLQPHGSKVRFWSEASTRMTPTLAELVRGNHKDLSNAFGEDLAKHVEEALVDLKQRTRSRYGCVQRR